MPREASVQFEFCYRTYSHFGPDATLHLVGRWLEARLTDSYGGGIETLIVEACCRNLSPPKATLEQLHSRFEEFLGTLPIAELYDEGRSIRVCFAAAWPTHADIRRDTQTLSVKAFHRALSKATQLLQDVARPKALASNFDYPRLVADVERARKEAPATIADLARLYLEHGVPAV